ncbi:hypothetical protein DFO67_13516 [Modicisalibacter xianhensis]|uniref:Uncharacterized protein n=1 Tax=Modicisalibacter xianhensis TaxID=442341 RepID=A0A4R8F843_9GAMM|nr:hypothetical protein [Halomonas xianhensis]TDX21606.1 hypothetical protein DFO67_13516 [Halomonas xianhensis]
MNLTEQLNSDIERVRWPKDLCTENRELRQYVESLESQALRHGDSMGQLREEVSRRDEQVRNMAGEVRELSTNLKSVRAENERLRQQVARLTSENAMLESDNRNIQRKIDAQLGSTY